MFSLNGRFEQFSNISIRTTIKTFTTVCESIVAGNMKQSSVFFDFELEMTNTASAVLFNLIAMEM